MVGIDFSFNNVKNTLCNNKYGLNCDGTRLPFKSNYFDFCFSINVLHHLPSTTLQESFLNEMIRVVKPNGKVFIFDLSLKNPIFALYLKYIFPRIRSIDEGDELFFNARKIVKKTSKKADLIGVDYYSFIPDFITQPLLNALMKIEKRIERTFLKHLGMHQIIILKKKIKNSKM
jgi:SAM-dependent methyltransferase